MIDNDRLIYQCGKHIVEYDLLQKKQYYIMKGIEDTEITAMNYYISSSFNLILLIGMKSNKGIP